MKSLRWILFFLMGGLPAAIFSYELVVATMFRDEANYLKEWIEYHRMVGADHFWLYNDRSMDHWQEVLQPYIDDGLVEVFPWTVAGRDKYAETQCLAFRDALTRAQGVAKWLTFIDIDEFLLPMQGSTVLECLETYFLEAHAVYMNWRCFGSGGVYVPLGEPLLFRLTACSFKNHPRNCIGKTIVRPEYADVGLLWYVHTCVLKEGGVYLNGDAEPMPPIEGTILNTDGLAHTKFIRINHYVMRDEGFFQNVRLARARNQQYDGYYHNEEDLVIEQNKQFSFLKDYELINFIKKKHPQMYETFWK